MECALQLVQIFGCEGGFLVEDSVDDAAGLTQFLMENMISQEYLEELYELYLEKYTLENQQN